MRDVRLTDLAGRQHNRVSREQMLALGFSERSIDHRLGSGRLVIAEEGVYAVAPLLDDDRGRWMGATLTAPETYLSRVSAGAAVGFWTRQRDFETVTRPGSGGPRRFGGVLVFRSTTLAGETTMLGPIPITTPERTLLDLAASVTSDKALARALREAVRLRCTTVARVVDALARQPRRRGTARLLRIASVYAGLPLERARSGAEVQALVVLRYAGHDLPRLNRRIAGEEADLSWQRERLIIEIDGPQFHLDAGEDERKQRIWEAAGWRVHRLAAGVPYDEPDLLLALAPRRRRERP